MTTTTSTTTFDAPPPRMNGFDFEDDDDERSADSGIEDRDDAQAVLQPALSSAATHLTLLETGEDEKLAALQKRPTGDDGYFSPDEAAGVEDQDDDEGEDSDPLSEDTHDSAPNAANTPKGSPPAVEKPRTQNDLSLGKLPEPRLTGKTSLGWPSPWTSGPRDLVIDASVANKSTVPRPRPSSTFLESAFGSEKQSPRPRRSGSAGQEALKRLREVIPSPTQLNFHMLPSFHGTFRSGPTRSDSAPSEDTKHGTKYGSPLASAWPLRRKTATQGDGTEEHRKHGQAAAVIPSTLPTNMDTMVARRPGLKTVPSNRTGGSLRRVASDDSVLYHVLSPQSSIDEGQFNDVHEMVNLRFRAIKESLPSLPKVNPNWRSSLNLSSFNSISDSTTIRFPFTDSTPRGSNHQSPVPTETAASAVSLSLPKDPLDSVLEDLTGDIVILGGYRGSILRSAEPPYQQLWAPVKVGLNMRKVNLEVGLDDEDEDNMPNTIRPSGMLTNMGPVDISRKFIRRLKTCDNRRDGKLRVWNYGYDWRLSPHRLSQQLCEFLASLPSNQPGVDTKSRGALVVAHSLGGLITRHAVNQRPELFSGVLYAGVPQRTINILGPFRNGDAVLFNEKLLSASVNFSIRTSFVFLPEDGFAFVDKVTGKPYPVDFYDPEEWARWKLSPCVSTPLRPAPAKPQSSSFASLLPSSLRPRGLSKSEKKGPDGVEALDHTIAPQMGTQVSADLNHNRKESPAPGSEERERYMEYLTRTLARTKRYRAELAHNPEHEKNNVYPPMAVLYGKSIPTVYAAQVQSRESILTSEAYSDLLFRAGDGVTLAKEAMLPEGYSVVKGGKVLSDRGHITLLGDLPAVGRALGALRRGRAKGIGLGEGGKRGGSDVKVKEG
ncbi:hypothetical protein NLU13_6923 [Sarocladium strictum]|uniref:Uncharacterized protein n=1 Tax=Sarocladium strictum TaxID=5046 RepID=A0AA39GEL2_SARSR|nr:hypothetical protein NLU13_6923 [Sarocladium strictum]